jgi:hypothetical protein
MDSWHIERIEWDPSLQSRIWVIAQNTPTQAVKSWLGSWRGMGCEYLGNGQWSVDQRVYAELLLRWPQDPDRGLGPADC